MKIWMDTDIGGDIDDALTILLAMASDKVKLVGVSTVFENTAKRAKIAKKLLRMGGYANVKVYAGIGQPLKATSVHGHVVDCGADPKTYDGSIFSAESYDGDNAVEMLAKTLEESSGGINILCIGALTNIAYLITNYPAAAKKINRLYIMGTAVDLNLNEFNITCDPEAADIVFSSGIHKTIVSLDVTFQCTLSEGQMSRLKLCESPLVKTVMKMCDMWQNGVFLHDPLTLGVMIDDSFVTFAAGRLKVELLGEYSRGKCVNLCDFNWKQPADEYMQISKSVKSKEFADYYVQQIVDFDKKLKKI